MQKNFLLNGVLAGCLTVSAGLVVAESPVAKTGQAPHQASTVKQREAADELTRILRGIRTLKASFQQSTLDAGGRRIQESSGEMVLKRPNMFRWLVEDPFPQEVLSDGQQVSYYDKDMEQVTLQDLDISSSATPALLLSGDTAEVLKNFSVALAKGKSSDFFTLQPKSDDSPFQELQLTFAEGRLTTMLLLDSLGSRTSIRFTEVVNNIPVKDKTFELYVPPGIDVIDQRTTALKKSDKQSGKK